MIQAFVLSLIYGPVVVTLGCWLFSAISSAPSKKEAVVRVRGPGGETEGSTSRDHSRLLHRQWTG